MTESIWPKESKGYCDFHENVILAHGVPKIGKSTFFSQFPDALFLLTEDGAKHLKVHGWRIRSWVEYLNKVDLLEKNIETCPYKTIIVDTAVNLAEQCIEFICTKHNIGTLGDLEYGKGYAAYDKEFKKQVSRLMKLGLGVCFVSHSEEKEVPLDQIVDPYAAAELANAAQVNEGKISFNTPSLDKRARKFLLREADIIMFMEMDENLNRVIRTKPNKISEAGDRSRRLPSTLPLSYQAVLEAYYAGSENLVKRVNVALGYCTEHNVEVTEKIDIETASIEELESYLQSLRILAAKNQTQEGEKQNATS